MSYAALKIIHVISVLFSYLLFTLRGMWMMRDSATSRQRWVKILPHIIDTVLLISAVSLILLTPQYLQINTWLGAKIGGLLLYIILGLVALRLGKTRKIKIAAWIAAQIVFLYIILVAVTKNPTLI
ncbi:MAG: SirB2 family protein [Nitrosospira sp.]|nr:SirB2 family protein [Nitrosospira sp.]MDW7643244.1 SirB2 family protein [Nitrosomonadaceae bacterium]MBI0407208.1 SirB2 family protein [Nitrosospira sp.]MBI0415149.1 SirB2 family protein [Nitrosospira sp.]MBI0415840.1 SirB2 family protein [Nitrosospira sp.]